MSGHAGEAIADLDADERNTTFLPKPFRLTDLEQSLRSVVGHDEN